MATATKTKPKKAAKKAKKATKKTTGKIHMALLLDESGSMGPNRQAVIDGTNEFVGTLKNEDNAEKVRVTLAVFDDRQPMVRVKRDAKKLEKFDAITGDDYAPCGLTPLYDSIAETISSVEAKMKKGDKAMVVIFTDGYENASKEFDNEKVKDLIGKKEKKGFTFIYLGANVDAQAEGKLLGTSRRGQALGFTSSPKGTRSAMRGGAQMAQSYLASGGDGAAVMDANVAAYAGGEIPEDDGVDDAEAHGVKTKTSSGAEEKPKGKTSSSDKARSVLRG